MQLYRFSEQLYNQFKQEGRHFRVVDSNRAVLVDRAPMFYNREEGAAYEMGKNDGLMYLWEA